MKKALILRCTFLHQFLEKEKIPLHPSPIQKCSGMFNLILFPMLTDKCVPTFVSFLFGLVRTLKQLSFCGDLIFLCLGTQPSNTGQILLYYHSYHEEAPFYLGVCPQFFNRTFIIYYFRLIITNNDSTYIVFPLYNIILTDKKYSKLLKYIMVKYIHKYKDHDVFVQH